MSPSYNTTNEIHLFLKFIFWNRTLHVSDSFSVHYQEFSTVHTTIGVCRTGYADCLLESCLLVSKQSACRVLFKNKYEKLVHRFGFIVRIYQDARSDVRYVTLCFGRISRIFRDVLVPTLWYEMKAVCFSEGLLGFC